MPTPDLLAHASHYARRGWPVFPLREGGKTPATNHGHLDATTDLDQVEWWWKSSPRANIGIAVPSGYLVIDEDPRNGGTETIRRLVDELGSVPPTLIARTRAGGYHYWFRTALPSERVRSSFGQGVDVKIARKGYVVAPPSVVDPGQYEWVEVAQVAYLPTTWAKRLTRTPRVHRKPTAVTDPLIVRDLIQWECRVLRHAVVGNRNSDLYRAARTLAERGCLSREAEQRLGEVATEIGLDAWEIDRTIRSAAGAVTK